MITWIRLLLYLVSLVHRFMADPLRLRAVQPCWRLRSHDRRNPGVSRQSY
jgi:hypothetical protein